jgi:membrane peptidoglycan carboxypeptidase
MQHAIVAVEDRRFYQNHGVDLHAMARALYTDVSTWHFDQGGATLTDQLVERTVPMSGNIIRRGFRILGVALAANVRLGKSRILDLYLNSVYYGQGAYGIGAAAQTYFHRDPRALDVAQAAFLAALPQAPSYYGRHPFAPATQARWRTVIDDLLQQGYITRAQARAARQEGIRPA